MLGKRRQVTTSGTDSLPHTPQSHFSGSHLIHILHLSVLIRLRGLTEGPVVPFVVLIFAFDLHLDLLALTKLLVALLDQDASAKLLWCGWWREVACKKKVQIVQVAISNRRVQRLILSRSPYLVHLAGSQPSQQRQSHASRSAHMPHVPFLFPLPPSSSHALGILPTQRDISPS